MLKICLLILYQRIKTRGKFNRHLKQRIDQVKQYFFVYLVYIIDLIDIQNIE